MATIDERSRLVERILDLGQRDDCDTMEEEDGENDEEDNSEKRTICFNGKSWERVCYTESRLDEYGLKDSYFQGEFCLTDSDVALVVTRGISKIKISYFKQPGAVLPQNHEIFRADLEMELSRLFGPAVEAKDGDDVWSLAFDDLIYLVTNLEVNSMCYRKLLLGMREVSPALKAALYRSNRPMEFRSLRSIFRSFGHELQFGYCSVGHMNNVMVILVREANTVNILAHRVRLNTNAGNPDYFVYHIVAEFRVYEKTPNHFQEIDLSAMHNLHLCPLHTIVHLP